MQGNRRWAAVTAGLLALIGLAGLGIAPRAAAEPSGPARALTGKYDTDVPGDWPMYGHDPGRTNINPDETSIDAGNVGRLVSRWQVNIGGNGTPPSGAPSVAGGRVYVGSSAPTGNNYFALDAISGAPLWSADVGYEAGCLDVGVGSTAAISGTVLAVGGGDAAYYGLGTGDGTQLWRDPLDAGPSGFAWASPLLTFGRAYVGASSHCDNPSVRGEIRALDLQTGALLAQQYFVPEGQGGAGIWNSPALSPDGGTLVVATGEDFNGYNGPYNRALVSLDPLTLAIRQAHQEGGLNGDLDFGSTPVIFHDAGGRVLVGASHKDGTFYTYVLDNLNAGAIWSRPLGLQEGMMPAYDPGLGAGGTLFIIGSDFSLNAVDPASGQDRVAPVHAGEVHGNMAIANGLIFLNNGPAGVRVLDERDLQVVATLLPAHPGDAYSGIAVAHGFVYWLSGATLNAWSLPPAPTPTATATLGPPAPTATRPPTATATLAPPAPTATSTPAPSATPCAITFGDVGPADYFYEAVRYLFCRGVLGGYTDGTFRPYTNTTRGQMVKIVVGAFAVPAYTPPRPTFADVPAANPFYAYIEAAAHAGIVSGYADGTFHPTGNVTRSQLAKITVAAAAWRLVTPTTATFADVSPASAFYPFVETAACRAVISGYGCGSAGEPCGTPPRPYFRASAAAVRGQIAKIVFIAVTGPQPCAVLVP